MGTRTLQAATLLLLSTAVSLVFSQTTVAPVTQQTLQKVAGSLQMYVDPLPQMPKIYGYNLRNGSPVPVNLTIGMYQKMWVCI